MSSGPSPEGSDVRSQLRVSSPTATSSAATSGSFSGGKLLFSQLVHLHSSSGTTRSAHCIAAEEGNGMGFFSSRKAEPSPLGVKEQASSTHVIRSRFYGRNKNTSDKQASTSSTTTAVPISTLQHQLRLPLSVTREEHPHNQSQPPPRRQVSADALTMSLAEKLNDLATANADGLLDDEEYRILRQNVFERYANAEPDASLPAVIPVSTPLTRDPSAPTTSSFIPRPPRAQHPAQQTRISRAPSIMSQRSISSTVSSLFRRATGRSSHSIMSPTDTDSIDGSIFSSQQLPLSPSNDTASIFSHSPSHTRGRTLSRQPSDDSLMTTSQAGSSIGNDIRSIMSRHRMPYASSISSRHTTRSAKPPSSFNLRFQSSNSSIPSLPRVSRTHEGDDDEDSPKTAAELRSEIEVVEAEGRKLLDAFNGLELTVLTKSRTSVTLNGGGGGNSRLGALPEGRQLTVYHPEGPPSALGSAYTLVPNGKESAVPLVAQPVNLKRKASVVATITDSFKGKASVAELRAGFLATNKDSSNKVSSTTLTPTPNSGGGGFLSLSSSPPLHGSRSSPNLTSAAKSPSPAIPISMPKKRPSLLRPSKKLVLPPSLTAHTNFHADPAVSNRPTTGTSRDNSLGNGKAASSSSKDLTSSPQLSPSTSTSASNLTPSSMKSKASDLSQVKSSPAGVPPGDAALSALEAELNDIRRKRVEVAARYESRLDFLRAKLKAAEIREKLGRSRSGS